MSKKDYKLAFKCKNCKSKLQIVVKEGMFGNRKVIRCNHCDEITSINVPEEQVFIDNKKKKNASQKKAKDGLKTEIGGFFSNQQFLRLEMLNHLDKLSDTTCYDVDQKQMTIGRKNSSGPEYRSDIEIANGDRYISKKHAVIYRKENKAFAIKDLSSTNGTWVNDEKMHPEDEFYIEEGDEIKIGKTIFKAHLISDNSVNSSEFC